MYLVWSERFKNSLESPYRLARSRTLDFHSKNRGSNPRGDARGLRKKRGKLKDLPLFLFRCEVGERIFAEGKNPQGKR